MGRGLGHEAGIRPPAPPRIPKGSTVITIEKLFKTQR